jgi:ferredoxin
MTALALRIDRCTGCGKCTRVCPEGALCMAENDFAVPAFVDGKIILRQSPRAACKACGLPMISQAELAYLSACLEDPAWLAYCPGCRSRFLS